MQKSKTKEGLNWLFFTVLWTVIIMLTASAHGFSQTTDQPLVPRNIVVEGKTARGAYQHATDTTIQVVACPDPRQWVSPDRRERGWACYNVDVQLWILNAVPPQNGQITPLPESQTSVPPIVVVQHPVIYREVYRPVIPGVGEVVYVPVGPIYQPVYSSRVIITRDAIRTSGQVLSSVYGRRRRY